MTPAVAILAGGLATRLRPLTEKIPKAMVALNGLPFIHHQMTLLKDKGINEVVLCVSYLGEQIKDYVGDGSRFGVKVSYSWDGKELLGSGGALVKARTLLGDSFCILYGDSYLDADYAEIFRFFKSSDRLGLMTVFKNNGKFDRSNVIFENGSIVRYDKKSKDPAMVYIDYGLNLLTQRALDLAPAGNFDLAQLLGRLVAEGQLAGFEVKNRFYEIGTPAGIKDTEEYIRTREKK